MKKLFYAFVLAGAALFTACDGGQTPTEDATKLWPAGEDDSNLAGYIDAKGKLVIVANYSMAYAYSCGWAYVLDGTEPMFLDTKGKRAKSGSADRYDPFFYNNRVTFYDGKLCGKKDNSFNVIVRADYDDLGITSDNGYCWYKEEGESRFGYMDKDGKKVIAADFDLADNFADGMAVVGVSKNGEMRYGVINPKGDYLIDLGKKPLTNLGEGRIAYQNPTNNKFGMMDKSGNEIIDGYDAINPFSCGLAWVQKNGKCGYIDIRGNEAIDLRYATAMPFYDNVAWVKKNSDADARFELIDKKGESLFKLKEKEIPASVYHNGLCLIHNTEKDEYRYIDKQGEVVYSWEAKGARPIGTLAPKRHNSADQGNRLMLGTEYGPLFMNRIEL